MKKTTIPSLRFSFLQMGASQSVPDQSIHELTVKDSKGKDVDLSIYKGKVLLVVNVASKCGFTDSNYTQLTELYTKCKDKGMTYTHILISRNEFIIRSHEGPDAREKRPGLSGMDEGYTIDHVVQSGKLITLFGAPDYPQFQATEERYKNKGAYIILEPPDFDIPRFHSYEAITPRPKVNPYYDFEDVIDSDEELDLASMVPAP